MAAAARIKVEQKGQLEGQGFGESSYTLYQATTEAQELEAPYLMVWLHGQDMGDIPSSDLKTMHRRLGRRTYFLVPMSPKMSSDGYRFYWGVSYTKSQNKNGLGFIFGQLHTGYLEALSSAVRRASDDVGAERVLLAGYSMGGFGAYQLGAYAPELFDAVVSVAGYGLGTCEPPDAGFCAPQPESSEIFSAFLDSQACRLAVVPVVLVVHALKDSISSFRDAAAIAGAVRAAGGWVELVEVPEEAADTDPSRKKKTRLGHHYFNYSILHDSSDEVLWGRLRRAFERVPQRRELGAPCTPPALARAARAAVQPPSRAALKSRSPRWAAAAPRTAIGRWRAT